MAEAKSRAEVLALRRQVQATFERSGAWVPDQLSLGRPLRFRGQLPVLSTSAIVVTPGLSVLLTISSPPRLELLLRAKVAE